MKSFFTALSLLTTIPIPCRLIHQPVAGQKDYSILFYPLVGLLIGLLVASIDRVIGSFLPPQVTSLFTMTLFLVITGALHVDGLADCADGFFSARPRQQILEIMHDSRSGPMGVVAICILLMAQFSLLMHMTSIYRFDVVVLMAVAGRCSILLMKGCLSYARERKGMGNLYDSPDTIVLTVWSFICLVGTHCYILGFAGLYIAFATIVVTYGTSYYCYCKIRGYTGDTLGACCEIVALIPPLVICSMHYTGYLC